MPPAVGLSDLPTCRLAGAGKGAMPRPFTIPGLGGMPTAGKAPDSGSSFSGREPHAIHGVTLPFAVILTAHRLQPPLHPARQRLLASASGSVQVMTSRYDLIYDRA